MLCAKCGSFVPDGANVCGVCGQPMAAPAPKKKLNVKALVIAGVAVVAVVVLCLVLFGGSSYSSLVDDYYEFYFEDEVSDIEDMAPEAYWTYVQKHYDGLTPATIENDAKLQTYLKAERAKVDAEMVKEYGSDWDIDWSVACDHEVTKETLSDLQKSFAEKYSLAVEDAREIHVKREYSGEDDYISYSSMYVVEIDGDWYLLSGGDFAVSNIVGAYSSAQYAN